MYYLGYWAYFSPSHTPLGVGFRRGKASIPLAVQYLLQRLFTIPASLTKLWNLDLENLFLRSWCCFLFNHVLIAYYPRPRITVVDRRP